MLHRLTLPFTNDFSVACNALLQHFTHSRTSFKTRVNPQQIQLQEGEKILHGSLPIQYHIWPHQELVWQEMTGLTLQYLWNPYHGPEPPPLVSYNKPLSDVSYKKLLQTPSGAYDLLQILCTPLPVGLV